MAEERFMARAAAAALAPFGVIVAHIIAYRAAAGGHDHGGLLGATGHHWWWWLAAILVTLAAYAAVTRIGRPSPNRSPRGIFLQTATVLTAVQVIAFVALETFERTSSGAGAATLLNEPVMALGVLIQIATALVAAVLTIVLVRVVSWLGARSAGHTRRTSLLFHPISVAALSIRVVQRPAAPRAPPSVL